MAAGAVGAARVGGALAVSAFRQLSKSSTRDRLLKNIKRYPDCPPLSFLERRRLRAILKQEVAMAALIDQDDEGESALTAEVFSKVFRSSRHGEAAMLSKMLMATFVQSLDTEEAFGVLTYDVRRWGSRQTEEFRSLGRDVAEVRDVVDSAMRATTLDPDLMLEGPLLGLGHAADLNRAELLSAQQPTLAAEIVAEIVADLWSAGYGPFAYGLEVKLARLWAQAGELDRSVRAWEPIIERRLFSAAGSNCSEPIKILRDYSTQPEGPSWLKHRAETLEKLEEWIYSTGADPSVLNLALQCVTAGDPLGIRWLMHAVECLISDGCMQPIIENYGEIVGHLNADTLLSDEGVRIRLAVAEATEDAVSWSNLIEDAAPGGRLSRKNSALIIARRGRFFARLDENKRAVDSYRFAIERGTRERIWDDARAWAASAIRIMHRSDRIIFEQSSNLNSLMESLEAGNGSILPSRRGDACKHALDVLNDTSKANKRSAFVALRRHLKVCVISARFEDERECRQLLGRVYDAADRPTHAVFQYIEAGDHNSAENAASALTSYVDLRQAAQLRNYQSRSAAFQAAAAMADLIPDELVEDWATAALAEAKKIERRLVGASTWENSYKLLVRLAERLNLEQSAELRAQASEILTASGGRSRIDDEIAQILVALSRSRPEHAESITPVLSYAFSNCPEVSEVIAWSAEELIAVLGPITEVLCSQVVERNDRSSLIALVLMGSHLPEVLAAAESIVEEELRRVPAYNGLLGSVDMPAIVAGCLPIVKRKELAEHYLLRILDALDALENRSQFVDALRTLAADLEIDTRMSIFRELHPLLEVNAGRSFGHGLEDPLGSIFFSNDRGRFRRRLISLLAQIASDDNERLIIWNSAILLFASDDQKDTLAAAKAGFVIVKAGYSINLPLESLANSTERRVRRMSAALLPYQPYSHEIGERLAKDPDPGVRTELAVACRIKLDRGETEIAPLIAILQSDPSYRVRRPIADLPTSATEA